MKTTLKIDDFKPLDDYPPLRPDKPVANIVSWCKLPEISDAVLTRLEYVDGSLWFGYLTDDDFKTVQLEERRYFEACL